MIQGPGVRRMSDWYLYIYSPPRPSHDWHSGLQPIPLPALLKVDVHNQSKKMVRNCLTSISRSLNMPNRPSVLIKRVNSLIKSLFCQQIQPVYVFSWQAAHTECLNWVSLPTCEASLINWYVILMVIPILPLEWVYLARLGKSDNVLFILPLLIRELLNSLVIITSWVGRGKVLNAKCFHKNRSNIEWLKSSHSVKSWPTVLNNVSKLLESCYTQSNISELKIRWEMLGIKITDLYHVKMVPKC